VRVLGASGSESTEILRFAQDDGGGGGGDRGEDKVQRSFALLRMTAVLLRMTMTERMTVGLAQDDKGTEILRFAQDDSGFA
jgi:hypothetical protein